MSSAAAADLDLPTSADAFPIALTEVARRMVRQALAEEKLPDHGLRVGVIGGGCSGLQYLLDFAPAPLQEDFVGRSDDIALFIDPFSAAHLRGTTIDYSDSLEGTGFKFNNPNIVRQCGCGSSFQT